MSLRFLAAVATLCALADPAVALELTPPQSEGQYYPRTKPTDRDADLTRLGTGPVAKGDVIVVQGRVVDPTGAAIAGARVEIWQTDSQGIYLHPGDRRTEQRDKAFQFYGEATSAADGAFAFRTILPAAYPGRPRHIHAKITPPGGSTLTTQFYFANDADLARDGIARRLGPALANVTLTLTPIADAADNARAARVTIVVPRRRP
jgi:protocatechuate 3,4-dioxygenase beta subunit